MGRSFGWAIIVCVCGVAGSARAAAHFEEPDPDEDAVHLGLSAGARFPVSASLSANLELPGRFRLSGGFGAVPPTFLRAVNSALVSFDAYRPEYGDFALEHIQRTRVLSASLGWKPVPRSGFFIEGGYSAVTLKAAVASHELISGYASPPSPQSTGASASTPASSPASLEGLMLDTTMHMVTVQGGWEWKLGNAFFRAGIGGAFTAHADSALSYVDPQGARSDLGPIGLVAEDYIDRALAKYGHTPFASLEVGYLFF